jgi:hypothetical protein
MEEHFNNRITEGNRRATEITPDGGYSPEAGATQQLISTSQGAIQDTRDTIEAAKNVEESAAQQEAVAEEAQVVAEQAEQTGNNLEETMQESKESLEANREEQQKRRSVFRFMSDTKRQEQQKQSEEDARKRAEEDYNAQVGKINEATKIGKWEMFGAALQTLGGIQAKVNDRGLLELGYDQSAMSGAVRLATSRKDAKSAAMVDAAKTLGDNQAAINKSFVDADIAADADDRENMTDIERGAFDAINSIATTRGISAAQAATEAEQASLRFTEFAEQANLTQENEMELQKYLQKTLQAEEWNMIKDMPTADMIGYLSLGGADGKGLAILGGASMMSNAAEGAAEDGWQGFLRGLTGNFTGYSEGGEVVSSEEIQENIDNLTPEQEEAVENGNPDLIDVPDTVPAVLAVGEIVIPISILRRVRELLGYNRSDEAFEEVMDFVMENMDA